jgi:hypothetical protein
MRFPNRHAIAEKALISAGFLIGKPRPIEIGGKSPQKRLNSAIFTPSIWVIGKP